MLMINECRSSSILKRESRRRTLLCCSTLCLFSFLILFFLLSEVFNSRSINFDNNLNKSIRLNLMKFHSSLFDCGQSVVWKENSYQFISKLTEKLQNLALKQKNNEEIVLNDSFDDKSLREEIIVWLEFVLNQCFKARQFSIMEQEKATIIRQIISFLRKEFLYISAFFLKESSN